MNLEFILPNNQLYFWNFIEATFWHPAHAGFDLIFDFSDTFFIIIPLHIMCFQSSLGQRGIGFLFA